jgi:hypothetical protein
MNNDLEIIKEVINSTVKRYENMLRTFRPTQPGGEYLEQNLITNFAIAFVQKFPNANVYTEIPFMCNEENNHWKCRLDLYIENGDTGYIVEAKGSQASDSLFELIEEDIKRIKSVEKPYKLKESFEIMADKACAELPEKLVGVVIADCWGGKDKSNNIQEERWFRYHQTETDRFKNINQLENIFSNRVKIRSDYQYHILTGIVSTDLWHSN